VADYYELLGVSRSASGEEIKRAYRRKARELHPDANEGDAQTAEQFKEVARAYQVLSDPEQRDRYDRYGEAGVHASGGPTMDDVFSGGLNDLFDAFFGGGSPFGGGGGRRRRAGPPRGQDIEVVTEITFDDAVFGATVPVTLKLPQQCPDCGGSGAGMGTQPATCADCGGSGQVQRVRQSLLGQMVTSAPCHRCGGMGEVIATPCPTCRGEGRVTADHTYRVDVPAGVDSGSTLRLGGRGAAGARGGRSGDLFVHLQVAPHERYRREGNDLVTDVPISVAQAALGTTIPLPTLDGDEDLIVPPGTQPGHEFRLRNRGVPRLQGRGRGDLRARLVVEVPVDLDADEEQLLRQLAAKRGEQVNPPGKGLFSRIKSAFS
jgi:molecular chaperone DnaJ